MARKMLGILVDGMDADVVGEWLYEEGVEMEDYTKVLDEMRRLHPAGRWNRADYDDEVVQQIADAWTDDLLGEEMIDAMSSQTECSKKEKPMKLLTKEISYPKLSTHERIAVVGALQGAIAHYQAQLDAMAQGCGGGFYDATHTKMARLLSAVVKLVGVSK